MNSPQPPQPPKTLLTQFTQAVQTIQAKVNFKALALKPNAKVPELWVQDAGAPKAEVYPLLGDRYLLGRSSKSCDIVVRNPVVSQIHLSLERYGRRQRNFVIKDENSTNGIYRGKRRLPSLVLRHGDVLTLGPPELAASVRLQYYDPPPWYILALRYCLYGVGGLTALVVLVIAIEWQKVSVYPLPAGVHGPVVVYSEDETPLRKPRTDVHRELRQLSDFSPYLPKALIASEDSRFYWHFGVDPYGILRALVVNFRGGEIRQGASTITQQVARSLFPEYVGRQENTAGRKLREAVVALKLETFYSKDEILRNYLNRIYLGIEAYGFEDAAQFYFDKSAKDLTLSEAATLVAILPAPNLYNPIQDYDTALKLRNRVISRMRALGMINEEEAQRARRSRIEVSPTAREILSSTKAPYFYSYVFDELRYLLGEELAQEGNFIVETSLDLATQAKAESSLRSFVNTQGANLGFSQGALVTLNTSNGEILAMVGGTDYKQSQFNRATQAKRQPGSTFKLFDYTAALEKGIPPGKTYSCAPAFGLRGCERSGGAVDMYTGMALSENVIAVRVAMDAGLSNVIETARRLGISSELKAVPRLAIGQSEVRVLDITGSYGAIANNGVWNRPHAIKRILDSGDCEDENNLKTCRVIYSFDQNGQKGVRAVPSGVASTMQAMLRGVVQSGTGRTASIGLGEEAGKTGTTDDNKDLWFIGFIPSRQVVTGIWLGNDQPSPTRGSSAQAAQLWSNYMRQVVGGNVEG